ncbi:MAG: M48 family metallopeptidase [Candidatus Eisenbacteria bacterium]|uniref:M48 family metallopeptidase n=1 Tax=Eiseniibacteriota bacterium TaxID=2212470 RepID=A0A849SH35_UNCEI|nr:M48 family metallopeptidase [Candidatus Eisenbacteria bacterium]
MLAASGLAAPVRAQAPFDSVLDRPALADSSARDSIDRDSTTVDSTALAIPSPPRFDPIAQLRAQFVGDTRAYANLRVLMWLIGPLWALAVPLLLLFSGAATAMRDVAHALGTSRWVRVLVMLTLYVVVAGALTLPVTWYVDHALERQFGLTDQSTLEWFVEQLKSTGFQLALFGVVPLLWLLYRTIERSPRRWWLWLGVATAPLMVAGALLEPLVFDPMFNRFEPLGNHGLERRIVRLAERAEIPARRVFVVDKSEQTRKYNAYVNGFGASQRIVLWDTLLRGMSEDEIAFVMAHEIGHYALGHIWKGMAITFAMALLACALLAALCGLALRRWGERWGIRELSDVASLPLLVFAISLCAWVAQPLANVLSRRVEREADAFALELTRDPDAGARTFLALAAQNRSNPEPAPIVRFLLYTHPTAIERVRLTLEYRPWEQGRANLYFHGPDEPSR